VVLPVELIVLHGVGCIAGLKKLEEFEYSLTYRNQEYTYPIREILAAKDRISSWCGQSLPRLKKVFCKKNCHRVVINEISDHGAFLIECYIYI